MQQVQPAQQPQIAIIKIADQAYEMSNASHFVYEDTALDTSSARFDCAGHPSDQAFQQTAGQNEDGDGHCGSFQFCQVCHTVALFLPIAPR